MVEIKFPGEKEAEGFLALIKRVRVICLADNILSD